MSMSSYHSCCTELCWLILQDTLADPPSNIPLQFGTDPPCPVRVWVTQILDQAKLNPYTVLVASFYLHKLYQARQKLTLSEINVRRCFLVAVMLATKYTEDCALMNLDWAILCGHFSVMELKGMELEMLRLLDFDLAIDPEELSQHVLLQLKALQKSRPEFVEQFMTLDHQFGHILSPCTNSCVLVNTKHESSDCFPPGTASRRLGFSR
ncbi:hypothetical protein GEMRC1_006003 [Eukaryota sp. GEM-RC1]